MGGYSSICGDIYETLSGARGLHSSLPFTLTSPCISLVACKQTQQTLGRALRSTGGYSLQWKRLQQTQQRGRALAARAGHIRKCATLHTRTHTGLGVVEESPLTCRQRASSPSARATPSPRLRLPRLPLRLHPPPRYLLPRPSLLLLLLLLLSLMTAGGRDRGAAGPPERGGGCMLAAEACGGSTTCGSGLCWPSVFPWVGGPGLQILVAHKVCDLAGPEKNCSDAASMPCTPLLAPTLLTRYLHQAESISRHLSTPRPPTATPTQLAQPLWSVVLDAGCQEVSCGCRFFESPTKTGLPRQPHGYTRQP